MVVVATTISLSAYKMQLTFACGEFWLNGKVMDTIIMKDFPSFRHNLKYKMTLHFHCYQESTDRNRLVPDQYQQSLEI